MRSTPSIFNIIFCSIRHDICTIGRIAFPHLLTIASGIRKVMFVSVKLNNVQFWGSCLKH